MGGKIKILNKNTEFQHYTNFKLLNPIQENPINNRDFLKFHIFKERRL
jgi:hypothetical protein